MRLTWMRGSGCISSSSSSNAASSAFSSKAVPRRPLRVCNYSLFSMNYHSEWESILDPFLLGISSAFSFMNNTFYLSSKWRKSSVPWPAPPGFSSSSGRTPAWLPWAPPAITPHQLSKLEKPETKLPEPCSYRIGWLERFSEKETLSIQQTLSPAWPSSSRRLASPSAREYPFILTSRDHANLSKMLPLGTEKNYRRVNFQ